MWVIGGFLWGLSLGFVFGVFLGVFFGVFFGVIFGYVSVIYRLHSGYYQNIAKAI